MTQPTPPNTDAQWKSDVERRLAALERSPQLTNASIKDGHLEVVDADGIVRAKFGRLDVDYDGDGEPDWGLAIFTPFGLPAFLVSDVGWVAPGQTTPLAPSLNPDIYFTASATYQEVGRVDFIATSRDWTWDAIANAYSANMDFRFLAAVAGDTPAPIYEQLAAAHAQYSDTFDLPALLGDSSLIGRTVTIRLELRLNSGTGPASFRFLTTPINWIAP